MIKIGQNQYQVDLKGVWNLNHPKKKTCLVQTYLKGLLNHLDRFSLFLHAYICLQCVPIHDERW